MHLSGHPAYIWRCELSFWRCDLYILKLTLNSVEPRKGPLPCVKLFTKVHSFYLILTDTENMTSHYVGLCQNIKT